MISQTPPMYEPSDLPPKSPPAFNVPGPVLIIGAILLVIHAGMQWVSLKTTWWVLENFAFIPLAWALPVEQLNFSLSKYWSLISYFFLHGDWVHVLANLTWFAAFGSAVARRFGTDRFLIFLALATIASAAAHLVTNWQSAIPVIGASGGISACMGAAVRFAFTPNAGPDAFKKPALSLVQSFRNRGVLTFVVMWFAFNWLFGAGVVPMPGVENGDAQIAWEAHMGGFIFGLLAFRLFDPK